MDSWEITYPAGLVKYVDFFRNKCFYYDEYDLEIIQYISEYSDIPIKTICTLGCGTGRNELRFTKMGYSVTGIERNDESIPIVKRLFETENVPMFNLIKADFMISEELKSAIGDTKFDCILLLSVPLSISDVKKAATIFQPYLRTGGLFIAPQYFGYEKGFVPDCTISESDYAEDPFGTEQDICLRTNIYKYNDNYIDWTATYIYYDEAHTLQMSKDHDILEILKYDTYTAQMTINSQFKLLPLKEFQKCSDEINMPKVKACIIGWKKLNE